MSAGPERPRGQAAPPFAVRGRLLLDRETVRGAVVVEAGRIVDVLREPDTAALPATVHDAVLVSSGFIDLQVNGGFGAEVGEDPEAIRHLAARLPATGVTAFLPTLVSSPPDVYPRACKAFMSSQDGPGARPLGMHLEGPLISLRRAGAHRPSAIESASPEVWEPFLKEAVLRLVTLAPEREGALEHIRRLRERGVVVSLGHTDASYEEFRRGVDAGATMVTHLFNAMSAFRHRAPGAVGAALIDDRVTAGLIADGEHSHPSSLRLAVRAKGPDRIALVTDAIAGAGMEPGQYQLGGQDIRVGEGRATLPDGRLAGSVLTLDQAVRNIVAWTETSVAEACAMASRVPAKLLGLRGKGRLEVGFDADLVLLDEALRVEATYREGGCVYRRGE